MRAYSLDLRQRIINLCEACEQSQREIAELFGVSESFITKLLRRWRATGSAAALPAGPGRPGKLDQQGQAALAELVRQQPDATLEELRQGLERQSHVLSGSAICRYCARLRLPMKKK
jgi:transposase